jgi:hypothetical protein
MGKKDIKTPVSAQPLNLFKKMQLIKSENDLIQLSLKPILSSEQRQPALSNGSALNSAHSSCASFQALYQEASSLPTASSSSSAAAQPTDTEDTAAVTSSSGANVLNTLRQVS